MSQLLTGDEPLDDAEAIGLSYLFVLAGLDTAEREHLAELMRILLAPFDAAE